MTRRSPRRRSCTSRSASRRSSPRWSGTRSPRRLPGPVESPGPAQIALLVAVALAAGTIDAIAGGGGLVTLPVFLAVGLPPHLALGTNKGQSVVGSLAGAALVLALPPSVLRPVVLVLLAFAALFIGLRRGPPPRLEDAPPPPHAMLVAGSAALVIGAYDGFFGPGTGTFLIVAFVALLGDGLAHASASAKVVNFASNLAALVLFAVRGTVIWRIALPMAAAQLAGGWIGAHLAVRRGDALVRRVVVAVALALAAKLAFDMR